MDELDVAYVAGVVDSLVLLRVKVKRNDDMELGYSTVPLIRINRAGDDEVALAVIDDYCAGRGIPVTIQGTTSTTLEISGSEDLRRFFDPLAPHIVQKHERLAIFLNEILPRLEAGVSQSKSDFVEMMEWMDELYEREPKMDNRKYDAGYFKRAWSDSLN